MGESFLEQLTQLGIEYGVREIGPKAIVIAQTRTDRHRESVRQAARAALKENLQTVASAAAGACIACGSLGVAAGLMFSPLWLVGVGGATALAVFSSAALGQFAYSIT